VRRAASAVAFVLLCSAEAAGRTHPRRLFVETPSGPLVSSDDGASWRSICEAAISLGGLGPRAARMIASPTGTLYAGLSSGLARSGDGGCSFELARGPLEGAWIEDVATSPARAETVYAVTSTSGLPNGLFVSEDDGATWHAAAAPDPVAFYRRIAVRGADAYVSGYDALGGGHPRLWKYTGATRTLSPILPRGLEGASAVIELVAASRRSAGLLYLKAAAGDGDALYRSSDEGRTWRRIYRGAPVRAAFLDDEDALFIGTVEGLFASTDGGSTFTAARDDAALGPHAEGWALRALLRPPAIAGLLDCPSGTPTHDLCEPLASRLAAQLRGAPASGGGASASDPAPPQVSLGRLFGWGLAALLGLALLGALLRRRPR
jgi:hypothetical protein